MVLCVSFVCLYLLTTGQVPDAPLYWMQGCLKICACEEWALYFEEVKTAAHLEQRKEESINIPTCGLSPGHLPSSFHPGTQVKRSRLFLDTCFIP